MCATAIFHHHSKWGQFVVVSSMSALLPSAGQAQYAACKSALAAFFHSLQAELADRGIWVTVAYPGPIQRGANAPRMVMGAGGALKPAATEGARWLLCVCRVSIIA